MNGDLAEMRQMWFDFPPQPARQLFESRIFQTRDIIEITVVESRDERFDHFADFRMVHQPARLRADRARCRDFHLVAVAVHPGALMVGRHMGQGVRGLEVENFGQRDVHRSSSTPPTAPRQTVKRPAPWAPK